MVSAGLVERHYSKCRSILLVAVAVRMRRQHSRCFDRLNSDTVATAARIGPRYWNNRNRQAGIVAR